MQGAQKLRSEVPEGAQAPQGPHAAQRSRWTFYETIKDEFLDKTPEGC